MGTVSEQLEFDLGDDVTVSPVSATSNYGGYGLSASTLGSITSIDISNMATSTITLPNSTWTTTGGNLSAYTISGGNYGYSPTVNIDTDGIDVKKGDIKVNGKSLTAAIEKIEERLAILHPNPELEDKWEQLRDLRRQYEELEKDLLEKEKIWKILNKK